MHSLSADEVRRAVTMKDAIAAVRDAFVDYDASEFDVPHRMSFDEGRFLVMPAHHRPSKTAMVKTLSLNFERTPAIIGTVSWSELNGTTQLVADAGVVTTLRTGAVSGVATDLLADPDARRLVLIGAGAQGGDQVRAVLAVREITSVTVVDRDREAADRLANLLAAESPSVHFTTSHDVEASIADADVISCATTSTTPLFRAAALPRKIHVNAIGAFRPHMHEIPPELLASASSVVVDDTEAVLEESGEIIDAVASGDLDVESVRRLGACLAQPDDFGDVTVFKSVGIAIQDWAIAHLLACRVLDS